MPQYELTAWLYGVEVAVIREARTRKLELRYTDAARDRWAYGDPVLSVALPLNPEPRHPPSKVAPFLEGLLPEGDARTTLESRFDVRRGDTLALLKAIGRDCAGAVVFQPHGDAPPPLRHQRPVGITHAEVVAAIGALGTHPLGDDEHVRLSLAGQQEKLLLSRTPAGEWARPIGAIPSTHILKPELDGLEHLVANEAFCLRVARELGLTSITVDELDADGRPVLVVSRYDRVVSADGQITRVHQEDLCQASSTPTAKKYEVDDGPSFRVVADILDRAVGTASDLDQLTRAMTLNVVVGNADAHAKNYSLLHHPETGPTLAPLYDVASTIHSPTIETPEGTKKLSTALAMRINGREDINAISTDDLVAEASSWPYGAPRARAVVQDLLERLPGAIATAVDRTPSVPEDLVERVQHRVNALASGRQVGD